MPKLKAFLKPAEHTKLDKALQALYSETEDGFVLEGVDDGDFKSRLDEFRTNNRTLHTEVKELKDKMKVFEGIDPKKHAKMVEDLRKLEKMEDADLIKEGKIDELLDKRTSSMKADFEKQLKAKDDKLTEITGERDIFKERFSNVALDSDLTKAANKVGKVRQNALDDVLRRGRVAFELDKDGKTVPKNGQFDKEGNPSTPASWAKELLDDAGFLFEGGGGGGGGGGGEPAGGTGPIEITDPIEFGKKAKDIASGKIKVK